MKKILFLAIMLCATLATQAQIKTYKSTDSNLDETVSIADITNTTEYLRENKKVLEDTKNVVTANQLIGLLTKLEARLDAIEEKMLSVIDAETAFATSRDVPYYAWGGTDAAKKRLDIDNGCLHYKSSAALENEWSCEYYPIDKVDNVQLGEYYTVTMKIKGSVKGVIGASLVGEANLNIPVTTEWNEVKIKFKAFQKNGYDPYLKIYCGKYVGEYWIDYIKISHRQTTNN